MKKYWISASGNSLALAEYVDNIPVHILQVRFGHEDNGSWIPWDLKNKYEVMNHMLLENPDWEPNEADSTVFDGFAVIQNGKIILYERAWNDDGEEYFEKTEWKIQEVVE